MYLILTGLRGFDFILFFLLFFYVYMHGQIDCAERGLVVKRGIERV